MFKLKAILDTAIPQSSLKAKSFKDNVAMSWSRVQQQMGMLNRGGDRGHASWALL